ncbi:MAG: glutathione S-transferase [Alphaproteobacteria bacterium]|nr:glutathione S-transferase [Alphaproteobacteria bacterium]
MLKVWGRRNAFNVQKVMWLIGELGLPHSHVHAGGPYGGLDDPRFLAMNPHGRVPVIDDDGTIIWESHAIIRYLAARHGTGTLWPEDPADRSFADRWMDWSQASLQPDFMDLFWGYYRTPEKQRDWPTIRDRIERCKRHFRSLDRHLAGQPYLGGARFTMADLPAGTALYRYFNLDIEHPDVPHVHAWYARLAERPASRHNVMLPFDDLKGRLAF